MLSLYVPLLELSRLPAEPRNEMHWWVAETRSLVTSCLVHRTDIKQAMQCGTTEIHIKRREGLTLSMGRVKDWAAEISKRAGERFLVTRTLYWGPEGREIKTGWKNSDIAHSWELETEDSEEGKAEVEDWDQRTLRLQALESKEGGHYVADKHLG